MSLTLNLGDKMNPFEQHRKAFESAHYATSFTPDRRAEQCIREFGSELAEDLAELGENSGNYKEKYIAHVLRWADRKSRTMSAAIVGPAKFPTVRNAKALSAEDNAWSEFRQWRERYFKVVNRKPILSPEDDTEATLEELTKTDARHALLLEGRKIVRKELPLEETYQALIELGLSDKVASHRRSAWWFFETDNTSAKIRRLKQKLDTLKARIDTRDSFETLVFEGGTVDIVDDRVLICHDQKPDSETIRKLKSFGFRWSPRNGGWSRKHTKQAIWDAKKIVGVE